MGAFGAYVIASHWFCGMFLVIWGGAGFQIAEPLTIGWAKMADLNNVPVGLGNTVDRFGGVAKTLHWLTALLILTMLILGVIASQWPFDTSDALATKGILFSIHKTLGLTTLLVAIIRILWAIIQPRPAPLGSDSKFQHFAAETVHWSLYGMMVMVPLTGWMHHAATSGFAPIWWPFGQTLFFIPQSEVLATVLGKLHLAFNIVLAVSIGLHVAGALKHHVFDRDATLKRMLPGQVALPSGLVKAAFHKGPLLMALVVWATAAGIGGVLGLAKNETSQSTVALEEVQSDWSVSSGSLSIGVNQFGQSVMGSFADWTAEIEFTETAREGRHGDVTVVISIPSLMLGGITNEALAVDFLNAEGFATATYTGPIKPNDVEDGYIVDGTLTLVGQTVPLVLPFDLMLDGATATASGSTSLDRRDYRIGQSYPDESTVGFEVQIMFDLFATQGDVGSQ